MKLLSILAITFLYLEIFSQETSGASLVRYYCRSSYSYCLTISDEKANWDTANATCVLQGGELINYANSWVNQNVQANNAGEYYWTGYRRVGNTSVFQSTDGHTISDYYPWKDIAGMDCVGIDGESGRYLSLECNTNNIVVCEIVGEKCYARIQQQYGDICSSSAFSSGIPTESSLRNVTLNLSLTTGDIINFYDSSQEIVISQLRANTQTLITTLIYYNSIQIATHTFQEDTTLVIHSTEITVQFNNASFILRSNLVTIYASNNSTGNLNISFRDFNYADYGKYMCVYLSSNGNISAEGLTTQYYKSERGVQCTTNIHGKITVGVYEIFETDFRNLFEENSLNYVQYNCEYSYTNCYTISDGKANWCTGYAACAQLGGKSNDFIYSRMNNINPAINGGEYYWTGWRRVGDTSVFLSTDGDNFSDYFYWKDNNPIAGIDCVGLDGESRKLLSLECDTNNTVVCKIGSEKCNDRVQEYKDICSSSVFSSGIPTESSLKNLTLNFSLTTGDIIHFRGNALEIVITQLRANTQTQIPIDYYSTIQIGTDTFQEDITVAIHKTQENEQITNTPFIKIKDTITIYSNYNSSVTVKIAFRYHYYYDDERCMYQRSDGDWSTDGVDTYYCRLNQTIQCTTKLQTMKTIAVERKFDIGGYDSNEYDSKLTTLYILLGILGFILLISVFLLLSSLVIFVVSGKKFFSHDINILHFNNTLSLFLAIISLPAIYPGVNPGVNPGVDRVYKQTPECFAISFFLQFLWTNVFLSSLSIAIVVFYTIWVVSINHTAKKLYKYLIPIIWGVSLVWALASTVYKTLTVKTCDTEILCLLKSDLNFDFGWAFLGPMVVILLINATLLILSLFKIWSVLRKQNSQEGELKRLRRVAIGGILLIPSLGLPFISLIAIQLIEAPKYNDPVLLLNYVITNFIIFLINSPIGIVHFILITCQIKETILRKYCCCSRRITPAQIAHSLHLNIARKSPKAKQETPNDVIPDSVPNTESTVYSNNSNEPIN